MKISHEVADLFEKYHKQLRYKFDVIVSFSYPLVSFIDEESDFVVYYDGEDYNEEDCGQPYLVKYNEFSSPNSLQLSENCEELSDLLIDMHIWIKQGKLIDYGVHEFSELLKWEYNGDLTFTLYQRNTPTEEFMPSYVLYEDIKKLDELKKHVDKIMASYGETDYSLAKSKTLEFKSLNDAIETALEYVRKNTVIIEEVYDDFDDIGEPSSYILSITPGKFYWGMTRSEIIAFVDDEEIV